MRACDVKSPEDALLYLADCQLATVERMARLKSRSVYEFDRQKDIARLYCNWLHNFGIDVKGTRVEDVNTAGSVDLFAARYEVPRKTRAKPVV